MTRAGKASLSRSDAADNAAAKLSKHIHRKVRDRCDTLQHYKVFVADIMDHMLKVTERENSTNQTLPHRTPPDEESYKMLSAGGRSVCVYKSLLFLRLLSVHKWAVL